ncbi:hypothetical protein B0T20DRAFT_412344 [Sordaria brevicollis]|uniref:DUF7918 domain-containing protein n=1 Tax=Sordaria brevicollis TaxID=83679 RepID=A0AAE0PCM0_SORBR|nr:hypothetical protein B0T20DRAFT_412344 [Sordaria brevicollis]
MAILSRYPGLTVNVKVDNELAKEYDAPEEEVEAGSEKWEFHKLNSRLRGGTPYSLSYIEAKPGKPFEFVIDTRCINLYGGEKPEAFQVTASLDGYHTSLLLGNENYTFRKCYTGNPTTGYSESKFKFASLDILEGPVPANDIKRQVEEAKHYGTLLIELHLVRRIPGRSRPYLPRDAPNSSVMGIAEKALKGKAVDTKTTFNSKRITGTMYSATVEYSDPKSRPFAVFEFRYRTMEGLIREAIVPRPAEVIDVEEEYIRIKRIKPEIEDAPRGIKREPMDPDQFAARYKQRRLEDGKVEIDLTDD